MNGLRGRLAWILRGDRYAADLEEQAAAIDDVQRRLAALTETVDELTRRSVEQGEFRAVADDLTQRVGALSERLDRER